jgi:hypothetical protein
MLVSYLLALLVHFAVLHGEQTWSAVTPVGAIMHASNPNKEIHRTRASEALNLPG